MHDLVCISHLRWDFVWQRPQHLLARLARQRRVFFVEEPIAVTTEEAQRLDTYHWQGKQGEQVTVLRLLQPMATPRWIGHGDSVTEATYGQMLRQTLNTAGVTNPLLWLYTPMADSFVNILEPSLVIYDVMDQLAAFKGAPSELVKRERTLLPRADVVLTGGISLYRDKAPYNANTHLFPSGVEIDHFAQGASMAMPNDLRNLPRPIVGYFGVIDERMDLPLLAQMAHQHPEWTILLIGPVVKIGEEDLPQAPNLHYLGMRDYADLPAYLAHFDVALVPFAMNDATRYLSPTKTLEYMAAHKPIVATPIPDVVELYGEVVRVGHSAEEFIALVEAALCADDATQRLSKERALLQQNTWDAIASRINSLLERQPA